MTRSHLRCSFNDNRKTKNPLNLIVLLISGAVVLHATPGANLPAGLFTGAVRARFPPLLGLGAGRGGGRGGVGSDAFGNLVVVIRRLRKVVIRINSANNLLFI